MNADIQEALNQLNKSYPIFEHKGKSMTKEKVKAVLEHGLKKGYKTTNELSNDEVDEVLKSLLITEAKKINEALQNGTLFISGKSGKLLKVPN
jgi:hypothetical protein